MAFNPVRRVRERSFEVPVRAELDEVLRDLAGLAPSTTTPYLTVSLDWRPSGADPEYRAATQQFKRESARLHQQYWPRGGVYDSLGADILRIRSWLTNDVDPSTKGIFIVANHEEGVFETITLGMPLQNRIVAGPVPALLPLARLDEDYPTYAVLVADQQRARVSLITQEHRVEELELTSSDYPRKQQSGGWSQRRFQQRADERLWALARQIAAATDEYLDDQGVDMLIIAGDEVITGALEKVMPDTVRERVAATVRLDVNATIEEIIAATMPLARRDEARREQATVDTIADLAGQGGRVATGSDDVMDALSVGRVMKLVLLEDFHEDGWADFANGRYGVGLPNDVFDGWSGPFEAAPIIVEEEMVRLAIATGAEVDVIHTAVPVEAMDPESIPGDGEIPRSDAAMVLDRFGGVAAILRY